MDIERDMAIVLGVTPFSNTSSILTWFSARQGRMATLAKGAHRPRSVFLGQADLFYTCEILYYPGRAARRLAILKECIPLKTRDRFRTDWRSMLCASYAALLLNRLCPSHAPHPPLFRLLDGLLDTLAADGNRLALLFWFELQVLSEMGLAPNLQRCTRCGTTIRRPGEAAHFSAANGGLICAGCCDRGTTDHLFLTPDILALLTHWQKTAAPAAAHRAVPRTSQVGQIERILGDFLQHHLDALYPGRGVALRCAGRLAS